MSQYEEWTVIFESGTDYESDIVRDRLDDAGLSAVVLTQRDHAFNLTHGDLAQVRVLVPPDQVEAALAVLQSEPVTDAELEAAAMAAVPAHDAHEEGEESMLDSGIEAIRLSTPEEEAEEEDEQA